MPPSNRGDTADRKRTAELLRRLRSLVRETRMLKADIDLARTDALTSHARAVHPGRPRSRE